MSEIKFPEGKYVHPLFYRHFVSNLCEYAKTTFHFINITIEDTREQKYFIVRQYSTIKDGIKNSCDKHRNHVLSKLCGAGGHQTGMDILFVDYNVTCSTFTVWEVGTALFCLYS